MATREARRIDLDTLKHFKATGRKFAMLTAYDYPTAAATQEAGVHALLIGDSMGTVLLGHASTQKTPLALMLILGEAVRRGAPNVFLSGDIPYEAAAAGLQATVTAARRFRDEAGCDAVKLEAGPQDQATIAAMRDADVQPIAHLGLRPQQVTSPQGYRSQARDAAAIAELVDQARGMVSAGAVIVLLEAVPAEAARAVIDAVDVPVIGCGAGPACDGHVLVTQDMLGIGDTRPPRFVPRHAALGREMVTAIRRYVDDIEAGRYPAAEHIYPMRKTANTPTAEP